MLKDLNLINLQDFEDRARMVMPRARFNMIDGGFNDEITFKRNQLAFDSIALRPRYLVDVSSVDVSTTVLGHKVDLPVMPDPAGGHAMSHPDGELATCRASAASGTIMVLSHASGYSMQEVAAVATGPVWAQVFILQDREWTRDYIQACEDAGATAICLTVDNPSLDMMKEQMLRNPNPVPLPRMRGNLHRDGVPIELVQEIDPAAAYADLDWVRSITSLPLVIKGILRADDARLCVEHGAAGIIVSTHAARLFDGMVTSVEALPEVVDAVQGRCEVYLDGGVRRGIDIIKCLALGARAVLIGRPIFYGLSVAGEEGVMEVFRILKSELTYAMAMCGRPTIGDLDRSLLVKVPTLYEPGGYGGSWRTG